MVADPTESLLAADAANQAGRGWRRVLLWRVLPLVGVTALPLLVLPFLNLLNPNGTLVNVESESISTAQSQQINVLQWNPHIECYLPQYGGKVHCRDKTFGLIGDLLQGGSPNGFKARQFDFAAIEYTGSAQGLTLPKPWVNLTYDCSHTGSGDDLTFLFNSDLWTPLDFYRAGCMGPWDKHVGGYSKPFVAQAFKSTKQDGMTVLAVGAHFNHPSTFQWYFWEDAASHTPSLPDVVSEAASRGITNVILMGDTNFATDLSFYDTVTRSSKDLMTDIGAAHAGKTKSTSAGLTCCVEFWYHTGYDRVFANFGRRMETELVLSQSEASAWDSRYMHLPVVGSLTV